MPMDSPLPVMTCICNIQHRHFKHINQHTQPGTQNGTLETRHNRMNTCCLADLNEDVKSRFCLNISQVGVFFMIVYDIYDMEYFT